MRPLGGRLDESEMLGSTPYTYYGGKRLSSGPILQLLAAPGTPRPPPPSITKDNKGHTLTDTHQYIHIRPQTPPGRKIRHPVHSPASSTHRSTHQTSSPHTRTGHTPSHTHWSSETSGTDECTRDTPPQIHELTDTPGEIPWLAHFHHQTKLDAYKSTCTLPHGTHSLLPPLPGPGELGTSRDSGTGGQRAGGGDGGIRIHPAACSPASNVLTGVLWPRVCLCTQRLAW